MYQEKCSKLIIVLCPKNKKSRGKDSKLQINMNIQKIGRKTKQAMSKEDKDRKPEILFAAIENTIIFDSIIYSNCWC